MEGKFQKMYLTNYYLFIAKDLWQAHHQILSIIFLNKFIKLTLITLSFLRVVFSEGEGVNLTPDPSFIFLKELI